MANYPMFCKVCGKPFSAARRNQKACSPECSKVWHQRGAAAGAKQLRKKIARGELVSMVCDYCGETRFRPPGDTFCCEACEKAYDQQRRIQILAAARRRAYETVPSLRGLSLAEVNALARKKNLTYGQFCAKEAFKHEAKKGWVAQ